MHGTEYIPLRFPFGAFIKPTELVRRRHKLFYPPQRSHFPKMPNVLTTITTLTAETLFLGTLAKRYFARVASNFSLRRDEFLYYVVFNNAKVLLAVYLSRESIECYHSLKSFMNGATRYIPDQLSAGFKVLNFWFLIQGTRSKNSNPGQTSAPHPRRPSISSASSFL